MVLKQGVWPTTTGDGPKIIPRHPPPLSTAPPAYARSGRLCSWMSASAAMDVKESTEKANSLPWAAAMALAPAVPTIPAEAKAV